MARRQRLIDRRNELRLTQAQVADLIGCDRGTYRRCEYGESTPHPGDWGRWAAALGAWTPTEFAVALVEERPLNGHAVPGWLGVLASFEQAAGRIEAYEATTVHGLLQIAEYATAVESIPTGANVARRIEARLARQAVLTRQPDPLALHVILDGSVLHRIAGSREVMAGQLEHLIELAAWPNVTIQVLPLDAGVFVFGSFTLFTHHGAAEPYAACVEDRAGHHILDRDPDREAHMDLFAYLTEMALSPEMSVNVITVAAKEYRS
jgi:transcriptional regulator with XRE-family HTH domain